MIKSCSLYDFSELREAYADIEAYREEYVELMMKDNLDVLLCPASIMPAPQHDIPSKVVSGVSYTCLYNLLDYGAGMKTTRKTFPRESFRRSVSDHSEQGGWWKTDKRVPGDGQMVSYHQTGHPWSHGNARRCSGRRAAIPRGSCPSRHEGNWNCRHREVKVPRVYLLSHWNHLKHLMPPHKNFIILILPSMKCRSFANKRSHVNLSHVVPPSVLRVLFLMWVSDQLKTDIGRRVQIRKIPKSTTLFPYCSAHRLPSSSNWQPIHRSTATLSSDK